MRAHELGDQASSIVDVVTKEKENAVSAGIVKDDESQMLSTLTEKASAIGERAGRSKSSKAKGGKPKSVEPGKGTPADASAPQEAAEAATAESPAREGLKVRQVAMRQAVSELDDSDELEGTRGAYDAGRTAKRAARSISSKKTKCASAAKGKTAVASGKATSAAGTTKAAAAKGAEASASQAASRTQAAAATTAKAVAASGNTAVAGAVGGSGLAAGGGVLCGVIAFVLVALVIGQVISALFGFWDAEDKKRSMEGLPPYITYEMVEEAIRCQEEYGHPAGCTIAQIICESGQGDHMSQLATRDHNLFGMKWASSFASAPEVAGKAGWSTKEEYTPGTFTTITAYFTVFKGDVECIRFRSRVFLQSSLYKNNALIKEAISTHSSDKMAEGLKDAGWATSSAYVDSLKSAMDTYNLRRFDSMSLSDLESGVFSSDAIVAAAYSQLGVPYVWGGTTPGVGLDCSGLTQYCYRQAGISIPRNSEDQASFGRKVPVSEASPGDILWRPGHVAIYVGDNKYIHEPHSGSVCTLSTGASYFTSAIKIR